MVDALISADAPMTLPEILDRSDDLAQSSAYRNLAELVDAGVVHRIVIDDEHGRYELAEAITGRHHHHLICVHCGSVADFTVPAPVEAAIETHVGPVAEATGFAPHHHRLDLMGSCRECR